MKTNQSIERTRQQIEELRKMPIQVLEGLLQGVERKIANQSKEIARREATAQTESAQEQLYYLYRQHTDRVSRAGNIRLVLDERRQTAPGRQGFCQIAPAEGGA